MSLTGILSAQNVQIYCLGDNFYVVVAKNDVYHNILDQVGQSELSFPKKSVVWILDGGDSTGDFSTLEESEGLVKLIKKIVWSMRT